MRAAFGLVGVLGLLIAIILFWSYAYLPYTQQVLTQGRSAQGTAEQFAGVDSQLGGRVSEHVTLDPVERGGKLYGLQVKSLGSGSSYETHYGVRVNDVIDQIGPQMVRDMDEGTAKALAVEAYQRQWELGIMRNGKHFVLPQDMAAAAAMTGGTRTLGPTAPPPPLSPTGQPAAATPTQQQQPAQPAQPAQPKSDPRVTPLMRQMDAILNRDEAK